MNYSMVGADFTPNEEQNPRPPPEHTFEGVPCSDRTAVGFRMAKLILDKAVIAAGAGALLGLLAPPPTEPAAVLGGAVIGFNTTGFSAAVYYMSEYQMTCVFRFFSTDPLVPLLPMEQVVGVPSARP